MWIMEALGWKDRPLQFPHSIPAGWPAGPPGPACILLVMGAHDHLGQPMSSLEDELKSVSCSF